MTAGGERRRRRKSELRRRMRELREAIPPGERARRSRAVGDRLFGLPEVRDARTLFLFSSFGAEVDTSSMIERAHAEGRRVLLPYVDGAAMEAAEHAPGEELVPSFYGAGEPARREPADPEEVDALIAPGLAFDRAGRRLGYGGGYYDRWLRRLRSDAVRIGICFSHQVVDRVPAGSSDERVRIVVTDDEIVRVEGEGPGPPL
jgi:5-formyltetrahydrofolate cyclo-ligase